MAIIGLPVIVDNVSSETGHSKTVVHAVLTSMIRQIECDLLWHRHTITIKGFGTFKVVDVPARKGRNPMTGETIDLPASRRVRFSASKTLAAQKQRKT